MKQALGRQEAQMLAYLQMRKRQTVRAGDLMRPLRLTRLQERELFRRLARGGLIARVRPGLFVVPPQLPLGGSWSPDEALALDALMQDRKARYQICGRTSRPDRASPRHAALRRCRYHPADGCVARAGGSERGSAAQARADAQAILGPHSLDSHPTEAREDRSALGRRLERPCLNRRR